MLKEIIGMLLTIVLVLSCAPITNAESESIGTINQDGPSFTICTNYTKSTNTNLMITSGQATSTSSITGYPGITAKVVITMHLEKKGLLGLYWSTITSWSQTFDHYSGALSKDYNVSGGTYRVKAVYVAYSSTASETFTHYSSEVKN